MFIPSDVRLSNAVAFSLLDTILDDFGVQRLSHGSSVEFVGDVPRPNTANNEHINLSLVGAIPPLANAVVATQIYEARGGRPQKIEVDLRRSHNYLDPDTGMTPTINGQEITLDALAGNPFISGIFETKDKRHVIPSAVYIDLVYKWSTFLNCAVNATDVAAAIKQWNAADLEAAAAEAGMPFAIVSSERDWLATEQGRHMAQRPIVPTMKTTDSPPKLLSPHPRRPLEGLKVLCATHAIAGPSAGRTLAEHGASVLQIMYTHGFEHHFVYDYANLGCASARLDFGKDSDRQQMWRLVRDADVWIDSYRDGAMSKFGFTDEKLMDANPSLIISHVRLYGTTGPWAGKPGFDMQGTASSGMMALCGGSIETPKWPPGMVINDYTTGYFGALAIQAAVLRRMKEGGGYVLSPSLTRTAMTICKYFKTSQAEALIKASGATMPPDTWTLSTGLGELKTLKPLPVLSETPISYGEMTLQPMGSGLPVFPGDQADFDLSAVRATPKEEVMKGMQNAVARKTQLLKAVAAKYQSKPSL